ncbi:MAG: hypothetical protein KC646_13005 [Candidatus Cloacimonetes bacterium]|nr:hypothetical protein [Candidatus Cloacimonadota bacterium]
MGSEKIELIKNFWEAHEVNFSINETLKENSGSLDLDKLNQIYSSCVEDLVKKDGNIRRKSLADLRSSQQEIMLMKEAVDESLKDHLCELERIGHLILDLF